MTDEDKEYYNQREIRASKYFMALVSENWKGDTTPLKQLRYAIAVGKPILVLREKSVTIDRSWFEGARIIAEDVYDKDDEASAQAALKRLTDAAEHYNPNN